LIFIILFATYFLGTSPIKCAGMTNPKYHSRFPFLRHDKRVRGRVLYL